MGPCVHPLWLCGAWRPSSVPVPRLPRTLQSEQRVCCGVSSPSGAVFTRYPAPHVTWPHLLSVSWEGGLLSPTRGHGKGQVSSRLFAPGLALPGRYQPGHPPVPSPGLSLPIPALDHKGGCSRCLQPEQTEEGGWREGEIRPPTPSPHVDTQAGIGGHMPQGSALTSHTLSCTESLATLLAPQPSACSTRIHPVIWKLI